MNSKEVVVKNKPVYIDKFFGKQIRSVKRLINTQSGIKSKPIEALVKREPITDADDESWTESSHKCKICKMRFANLRSLNKHARVHSDDEDTNSHENLIDEEVKNEPATDTEEESSTENSHICKICKMRFVNLRSLNKHARIHSDEEAENSDEKSKEPGERIAHYFEPKEPEEAFKPTDEKSTEGEVKNEPIEPENVRSKQESTRETGYKKQHAMKRRNKSTFMPSISLLKHEPIETQTVDIRLRKSKKTNKRK